MFKHFTISHSHIQYTVRVHVCLQYLRYSISSTLSRLLMNRWQGSSQFYSLWHRPPDCALGQRVLWQHSGGTEEEILLNLIQSEMSLRRNFMAFSTYVLLSEWMRERNKNLLLGSVMSHSFWGVSVNTRGCSLWLFCICVYVCTVALLK